MGIWCVTRKVRWVRGMMGYELTREQASALSTPSLPVVVRIERLLAANPAPGRRAMRVPCSL
jgi:hypothetical protein